MIKCEFFYLDRFEIEEKIEEYYNKHEVIDIKIIGYNSNNFDLFVIYR